MNKTKKRRYVLVSVYDECVYIKTMMMNNILTDEKLTDTLNIIFKSIEDCDVIQL